ncbi:MAG: methyltransferase domain-containing protein [Anaerolineae bacterium]
MADDPLNTLPPVTRVRRSKEEARSAYDRMSTWYDLLAGPSERKHRDAGLRTLNAKPGEIILEIGFGTGHGLTSLARAVGESGQVCGVDISEEMARLAAGKLEEAELHHQAGPTCGDGAQLPFRDGFADGVFMSFTLELFDTPRMPRVLDECQRVLQAGGRVCVVSLAKREGGGLPVRLYEWVHHRMPKYVDCRPIPVAEVMEGAGFEVVETERRSMRGLPVDVVLCQPITPASIEGSPSSLLG